MTRPQPQIQMIPLNKLVASPRNVRRVDRKADIDSLAASIASQGLLQNLCVVPAEDKFEVDAGGRRLAALKKLARDKVFPKDHPVPCHVVQPEEGREVSLTENIHRVGMDAIDEVDAFSALVAEGLTPDQVAHRFGVTRRHVDQRLALAGLSPKIKAAWKRGDVTLEAARAFCLVDDHGQQEAVFRTLGRPLTHAGSVRARLMDGRMKISDRLAVFVGLEAYELAGGKILRDLFDTEAAFIQDPALLTKLAEDKLEASRAKWLAEGWSWVEIHLGDGRWSGQSTTRLHPDWREPTPDEQTELDRIAKDIEKLDADLEAGGIDDDPRWSERDDLEAAYETIRQAGRCWLPKAKELAGVVLSLAHDGQVSATEGLVRSEDQKHATAFLKKQRAGQADGSVEGDDNEEPARASKLTKAVNRDLTLVRTQAIRLALAGDPDVALALCVASMAVRAQHVGEMPGVAISVYDRPMEDLPELQVKRAALVRELSDNASDTLAWALDLSRERLLAVLSVMVAGSVDLAHEDAAPLDLQKQAVADRLAQCLDVDMRQFWTAGIDFWARLPKASLLEAYAEAPGMADRSQRAREEAMRAIAKLRKDELAAKVSAAFEGTGYLPDILITPIATGVLALTDEGNAVIQIPGTAA